MGSPAVWADARARIEGANLGYPISWPNEAFDYPATLFLMVEISGQSADPWELTGGVWEEHGTVWVHVMAPSGTGITDALNLRKAIAGLFRNVQSGGIVYRTFSFDPGQIADEAGNWYSLSLGLNYIFRDIPA